MFTTLTKALNRLYATPERLLRFSLNNALRPYLKYEVQQKDFQLGLFQGRINIEKLLLNEKVPSQTPHDKVLNKKLNGVVPFQITSACIGALTMDIPWTRVAQDNVKVVAKDLVVYITFNKEGLDLLNFLTTEIGEDANDLEKEIERAVESSLEEVANMESENDSEGEETAQSRLDDTENLGIQSVEDLFENIFSHMNIIFEQISIFVQDGDRNVCLSIGRMNYSNENKYDETTDSATKEEGQQKGGKEMKEAEIENVELHIISPDTEKGRILHLPFSYSFQFTLEKTDSNELSHLKVEGFLGHALRETKEKNYLSLTSQQLEVLLRLFQPLSAPLPEDLPPTKEETEEKEEEKHIYPALLENSCSEQDSHIQALSRSIMKIAPFQSPSPPSNPINFVLRLVVELITWELHAPSRDFSLEVKQSTVAVSQQQGKNSVHVSVGSLELNDLSVPESSSKKTVPSEKPPSSPSLSNENKRTLLKVMEKKQPLSLDIIFIPSEEQPRVDISVSGASLHLWWNLQAFAALASFYSPPVAPSEPKGVSPKSIITFTSPSIHVMLYFPPHWIGQEVALEAQVRNVGVHSTPSAEATLWTIEFDLLKSLLHANQKHRTFAEVWTSDPMDRPRVQITLQEAHKRKQVPSMMIDLPSTFQHPLLFSFYSSKCTELLGNISPTRTIDLEETKRAATSIVEVILPNCQVELHSSEWDLWSALSNQFGGPSSEGSANIISVGSGTVLLRDGEGVLTRPFAAPPTESEYRLEVTNFRSFYGIIEKGGETAPFFYLNTEDLKLLDDDSTILLRKTPRQLRMSDVYCSPFALSVRKLDAAIYGTLLGMEEVTFGTNVNAWRTFICLLFPSTAAEVREEKILEEEAIKKGEKVKQSPIASKEKEHKHHKEKLEGKREGNNKGNREENKKEESEGGPNNIIKVTAESCVIYYQPSPRAMSPSPSSPSSFVPPPRALLTASLLTYSSSGKIFSLEGKEVQLWLKEDFHYLRNSEIYLDLCHPTLPSHLTSKSLVPVSRLGYFRMEQRAPQEGDPSEISVAFSSEERRENPLTINVKADTYESLLKVFSLVAIDIQEM